MFETVLPIIVPIFACAGLGWLWIKFGRPFDIATMTPLVTYIGAPCLVFSSMVHLSVGAEALADMVLATTLALVCFGVIGAIGLRIFRLAPSRYLSPLVFTNTGNMGMPLCLFAFGAVGLELAAVFFTVSMVMMLLFGVWLMSGEATPKKVFAAPLPYALAAAFAFLRRRGRAAYLALQHHKSARRYDRAAYVVQSRGVPGRYAGGQLAPLPDSGGGAPGHGSGRRCCSCRLVWP